MKTFIITSPNLPMDVPFDMDGNHINDMSDCAVLSGIRSIDIDDFMTLVLADSSDNFHFDLKLVGYWDLDKEYIDPDFEFREEYIIDTQFKKYESDSGVSIIDGSGGQIAIDKKTGIVLLTNLADLNETDYLNYKKADTTEYLNYSGLDELPKYLDVVDINWLLCDGTTLELVPEHRDWTLGKRENPF